MRLEIVILLSFSNIAIFLNFFKISPDINSMLYLCNVLAFAATLVMLYLNPLFQYERALERIHFAGTVTVFNLFIIVWHALPVYLFRNRQTLHELFMPKIIVGALAMWLIYFVVMYKYLYLFYSLAPSKMIALAALFLVACCTVSVVLHQRVS